MTDPLDRYVRQVRPEVTRRAAAQIDLLAGPLTPPERVAVEVGVEAGMVSALAVCQERGWLTEEAA